MQPHIINYATLREMVAPQLDALQPQTAATLWRRIVRNLAQSPSFHETPTADELARTMPPYPGQPVVKIRLDETTMRSVTVPIRYLVWAELVDADTGRKNAPLLARHALKYDFVNLSRIATRWWDRSLGAEIERGDVCLIKEIGDYAFVRLVSEQAFQNHGKKNDNCIGKNAFMFTDYYGESLIGDLVVFALVNRRTNDHHASIVVDTPIGAPSIREITGKQNVSAHPRYVKFIRDFVIGLYGANIHVGPEAEISMGWLTVDGKRYDLLAQEPLPQHVVSQLNIHRSMWPVELPESFVFSTSQAINRAAAYEVNLLNRDLTVFDPDGRFFEAQETRRFLEEKGWRKQFERDRRNHLWRVAPVHTPVAVLSDSRGIKLPKTVTFNGSVMFNHTHAATWPDTMDVFGAFDGSYSNIVTWRAGWHMRGRIEMYGSALENIESGARLSSRANFSNTPLRGFPDGFEAEEEIKAHNTPSLHHISRLCVFDGLDLTGSGLRDVDPHTEIDGDFIVDNTEYFRISPPNFVIHGNYYAQSSNLEQIGSGTYVKYALILYGSNVTHLPDDIFVGQCIQGPDGKQWDTRDSFPTKMYGIIDEYNNYYKNWKLGPTAPGVRPDGGSPSGLAA